MNRIVTKLLIEWCKNEPIPGKSVENFPFTGNFVSSGNWTLYLRVRRIPASKWSRFVLLGGCCTIGCWFASIVKIVCLEHWYLYLKLFRVNSLGSKINPYHENRNTSVYPSKPCHDVTNQMLHARTFSNIWLINYQNRSMNDSVTFARNLKLTRIACGYQKYAQLPYSERSSII